MQFHFTQHKLPSTGISLNNNYKVVSSSNYSSASPVPTFLSLLERPKIYTGHMNGYHQPVARIKIQAASFSLLKIQFLQQALHDYFDRFSADFNTIQTELELITCLGQGIWIIQKAAGLPIFEPVKVDVISKEENIFNLWIPVLHEDCFHQATAFMLQFISFHIASESNLAFMDEMNELINELKNYAPNMGTRLFLEAAFYEGIPWLQLPQNIFQCGYGRYSRWLDSSFIDTTSVLGARVARDKLSTSIMLKKAGLPVPSQKIIRSEAEAVKAALQMGYPVVIKPHNQDAGKGVFAGLVTKNQVKQAYASARKYSEMVLLEKHIVGKDYRLLVFNGELIWAVERIPAGVTGDGSSTIGELIHTINQLPERAMNNANNVLKQIEISEDTHIFLAEQGYEINSVLKQGQFLPVSRIANISSGGTPVAVFDQVHPDNKRLAETAANLLRLNLAGIDFICSDIQQSYLTTGGCLIEVNGQPQLGVITAAHIYKQILTRLMKNQGRIPIFVICSHSSDDLFISQLHLFLAEQHQNIGIARGNCAYINSEKINHATSLYNAAESLLLNTNVDALIYCINHLGDIEIQGLPFDSYDCLFFLEAPLLNNDITKNLEACLINTLFKASHGMKVVNENTSDYLAQFDIGNKSIVVSPKNEILRSVGNYFLETKKEGIEIK